VLLHNFSQPSHNTQAAKQVHGLFDLKTCLLLEGLSCNWGFYFTALTQPDGVGSDLEEVQEDLEPHLKKITDRNGDTALIKNWKWPAVIPYYPSMFDMFASVYSSGSQGTTKDAGCSFKLHL
jgi:hypothetical protein